MDWYERLANYFPEHEMKHPGQLRDLLDHHEAYRKLESPEFIVTYAEFADFLFIDYLLVNSQTRGKGTGSRLLDRFKQRGKTLIVEVELPDVEDTDTLLRVRFYERNGFKRAERITYTRSDEDGEPYTMDVYYWSPSEVAEKSVLHNMKTICREIHNFRSEKYYGRLLADPEEVLDWEN
ncbi:GNAT family N-acetyltransferase [Alicyclobacillus sp. ALC3]|uniref:GNAT family N-acetyltransferase n=1 Tax=Alicyclobacillus sp. ALC3 TaxID=2796143 RepID=UPI0023787A0C|nr:GNAT family N-acetyltransferase [Alicyclobacillus sp. ALC3]WDL98744.1 GNAT family N-acetyltransferase [Alicyclobacillus sp. ALC3]